MQDQKQTQARRPQLYRAVVAIIAAIGSGTAWADEPTPYSIGASIGVTRNSNVFQEQVGRGDTFYSYGVLAGVDQMFGRQHVTLSGSAQANRYQNFDQLNNTSYGLTAGLDWSTIERLSGTLRYDTQQGLVNYADANLLSSTQVAIKDLQKTQQFSASVRYGDTPGLAIDGGAERRTVDFSAVEDKRGYSQNIARLGLLWGKSDLLTLGLGARVTQGDYPQAVITPAVPAVLPTPSLSGSPRIDATFGPDKSNRRDIDFNATWSPSGVSVLTGRISLGRETHSQPTIPEFSGVTGAIGWNYKPAGRLAYKATISRDTASENTFATLPAGRAPVRTNNDSLTTVAALAATYELTAKTSLNAEYSYNSGSVFGVDGSSTSSSTQLLGIGASYQPTRNVGVSCRFSHETRGDVYTANVATCSAQIVLR